MNRSKKFSKGAAQAINDVPIWCDCGEHKITHEYLKPDGTKGYTCIYCKIERDKE